MIKKIRRNFILIAMLSVLVVLGAIIGVVNAANYASVNARADAILSAVLDNGGELPDRPAPPQGEEWNENAEKPEPERQFSEQPPHGGQIPDGGEFNGFSPDEARYFAVTFLSDGSVTVNVKNVAAVEEETAKSYAEFCRAQEKTNGWYENYKFRAKEVDGGVLYAFLDCSRELTTFKNFLFFSLVISGGGLVLVFLLVLFFSRILLRPVEESYLKQKRFITNAGHDIKTPLAVIATETEVLELEYGENEWTKDIKKQISRLSSLTEKLVFLSKMEESAEKPVFHEFDLSAALEEVVAPYRAATKAQGVTLRADFPDTLPFNGDEERLKQAFALLMDNALKYTPQGGNAWVSLKKTGKNFEIRFGNDANVTPGKHDELFERFYRGDGSRNAQTGGHGIGLSVVEAVVRMHGGKISAYSADGKTLEFILSL